MFTPATIRSIADLESLKNEWNMVADQIGSPLLRHEWLVCCAQTFAAEGDLRVVVVRQDGRLVAAAPLVSTVTAGGRRLELIGMSALHEPSGFLFTGEDALRAVLHAVVGLNTPIVLQRIDHNSLIPTLLQRALPWPGIVVTKPTAPSLSVRVTTTWSDYQRSLSSRITCNLRRIKGRSKALGAITTSILSPTESQVDALLEQVMEVEGSGWKGKMGSAMASNAPLRDFFIAYSRRAAKEGILRVALLHFGERIAAVELAVEAYQRWWQLKIGYAGDLARFYPGLQLTEATIRYAFDRPLQSYEFLGSAASWEESWRPEARGHCVAIAYPRSLSGIRALTSDAWRSAGRPVVNRLVGRFGRPS